MEKELLIIGYFERTLNREQQKEFERLMKEDEEFASEVAFQREVQQAMTLNERKQAKLLLQSRERARTNSTRTRWWMAAAAFILMVGGGIWWSVRPISTDALYAHYYQTYPNTIMPAVRGKQAETVEDAAFSAYDRADFVESDTLFQQLYRETGATYALFYRGISLLELEHYEKALSVLEQYPKGASFGAYASWYRALAYLKLGKSKQAVPILSDLADEQSHLGMQARGLLDELP